MEATKSKNKDTEHHRNQATDHGDPVLGKDFVKDVRATQTVVDRIVSEFLVVYHKVGDAHGNEESSRHKQVRHKIEEQAATGTRPNYSY